MQSLNPSQGMLPSAPSLSVGVVYESWPLLGIIRSLSLSWCCTIKIGSCIESAYLAPRHLQRPICLRLEAAGPPEDCLVCP